MRVLIPDTLRFYTQERHSVETHGATLDEALIDLNRRYPGIRFRIIDEQDAIRRHIRIFINGEQARALNIPLHTTDEIIIIQALSGG